MIFSCSFITVWNFFIHPFFSFVPSFLSLSHIEMGCEWSLPQRDNISNVRKVQPHMSCEAEGRLCEVRPIPHGPYSSQQRDHRPAILLNHHHHYHHHHHHHHRLMLFDDALCVLWEAQWSINPSHPLLSLFATLQDRTEHLIWDQITFRVSLLWCLFPFTEWTQRAALGLERRPC